MPGWQVWNYCVKHLSDVIWVASCSLCCMPWSECLLGLPTALKIALQGVGGKVEVLDIKQGTCVIKFRVGFVVKLRDCQGN